MSNKVNVPSFLTRGMSETDADTFKTSYRNAAFVLQVMKERLEHNLNSLVKESEACNSHQEFLFNAAERKAMRHIIDTYLP